MFLSSSTKIPVIFVSVVTGVCMPGKQFYILKNMWTSYKAIRKTNNSEMGKFSTFTFSVSFFGPDIGIWDSKGSFLETVRVHLPPSLSNGYVFSVASRGIICMDYFYH